jgi:hypothetical protein
MAAPGRMFAVVLEHGPAWADARGLRDGHLRIAAVEPWTVLLDGRAGRPA